MAREIVDDKIAATLQPCDGADRIAASLKQTGLSFACLGEVLGASKESVRLFVKRHQESVPGSIKRYLIDCFLRTEQIKVAFLNVGSGNAEGIPTFVNTVVVNNIDVVCLAEVAEIGRGDNARGARLLCEKLNQHARLHARQVTYTCWYLPSRYALIWRTTGEFQGVQVRAIHDGLGNGRVRYGVFEFIFPKDTLLAPLTVVLVHLRTKRARGWDVNRIRNAAMPKLKKLILKPNTVVLGDFNMSPEDLAARSADVGLNLPWPGAIHDYPITTPKGRKLDFIIYKSRVLRSEVVEQAIADHHMVIAPITIRRVRH